jgi:Protein of unknown function (DUF3485)
MTAVLMGTDRTSIHSPYFCLTGQGWEIDNNRTVTDVIHMDRPRSYELPVNKMFITKTFTDTATGRSQTLYGWFVYWYVDGSHYTANANDWMAWWMPRDLLLHGVLERWAYISVFTYCLPGQETAAYERVKQFIALTVPEYQLIPEGGGARAVRAP